ncbi:hypothetical protein [Streptantibioticus silvisoli]|uniref:Integral membrane protein n=1 Tax=Streptantibioticus silvisoli TaxID=2705255 RepID=A0ABT6W5Q7_9ACTN|nr:hypothetical protein [Streptantibioticus silvisoli]MDI5965282.1 hypothetical protein [Streptantibioticus silvisoli]
MLGPVRAPDGPSPAGPADPLPIPGDLPDPGARPVSSGLLPGALSLRLALRARPVSAARRLLLAAVSAATGYLLLACLGDAADGPWQSHGALVRLAWCLVPLAVVALLAVAVGRAEVSGGTAAGLATAGFGPARLPQLAAAQVAQAGLLGSAAALVTFVYQREQATDPATLPYAGLATLLLAVPLVTAAACLVALRPRRTWAGTRLTAAVTGVVALAAGVLLVHLAGVPAHGGWRLPGGLGRIAPATFTGWALALLGTLLAAPGLLALTGLLLSVFRPGARRLLAGRALRGDAGRLGPPVGLLASTAVAAWSAHVMRQHATRPAGHLTLLAAAVVVAGALACLAAAADDARRARATTTRLLTTLGAGPGLLRSTAYLRTAVLLAVCGPLTAVVAWLAVPGVGR